jgi:hypothetical protein
MQLLAKAHGRVSSGAGMVEKEKKALTRGGVAGPGPMRRTSEQNDSCNLYCLPSAASLRSHRALILGALVVKMASIDLMMSGLDGPRWAQRNGKDEGQ